MASTPVPPPGSPTTLGLAVRNSLSAALDRPATPPADMHAFLKLRAGAPAAQRQDFVITTSLGALPHPRHPDGMSIIDWRRLTGSHPDACTVYATYTYAGRLSLLYFLPASLFTAEQVDRLVTGIVGHLVDMATAGYLPPGRRPAVAWPGRKERSGVLVVIMAR